MNCYFHNYTDAVAICSKCGAALCIKCVRTTYDNIIICPVKCDGISANLEEVDYNDPKEKRKIKNKLLIIASLCIGCFLFGLLDKYNHWTDYAFIWMVAPFLVFLIFIQLFLSKLIQNWVIKVNMKKMKRKDGENNEMP